MLFALLAGNGIAALALPARTAAPATSASADSADLAWSQLTDAHASKREDSQLAALNALSLLGGDRRAEDLIRLDMRNAAADIDVRTAAIIAAGQMERSHTVRTSFRPELRTFCADPDPKLSFTAASTLWALHDPAGQAVLLATAQGERAGDYSFLKRSEHTANRTLHSPEALAKIAVQQGLTILVPPVGMGMGAYGYLKGSPGASPQVIAIEQLARETSPAVDAALIGATHTRDAGARIAAAESLANFRSPAVREALRALLTDDKLQVRLTASAAYLRVTEGLGATGNQVTEAERARPHPGQ